MLVVGSRPLLASMAAACSESPRRRPRTPFDAPPRRWLRRGRVRGRAKRRRAAWPRRCARGAAARRRSWWAGRRPATAPCRRNGRHRMPFDVPRRRRLHHGGMHTRAEQRRAAWPRRRAWAPTNTGAPRANLVAMVLHAHFTCSISVSLDTSHSRACRHDSRNTQPTRPASLVAGAPCLCPAPPLTARPPPSFHARNSPPSAPPPGGVHGEVLEWTAVRFVYGEGRANELTSARCRETPRSATRGGAAHGHQREVGRGAPGFVGAHARRRGHAARHRFAHERTPPGPSHRRSRGLTGRIGLSPSLRHEHERRAD